MKNVAGPSVRALAAAAVGRLLVLLDDGRGLADYGRSGDVKEEVNGVTLSTSNVITVQRSDVQSRLTWQIVHELWTMRFTERRSMEDDGSFVKSAPHQVSLQGDLVDAARFLGIPRELFYEALRADGWSYADVTIERMRWLNIPYFWDPRSLRVVMESL